MSAWTRIAVIVPESFSEAAEDCLLDCGAASVTLLAADNEELFAVHGGDAPLWQRCRVEGLFESAAAWSAVSSQLALRCPGAVLVPAEGLAEEDWQNRFRQYAVDEVFGDRLRLAPRSAASTASPPSFPSPNQATIHLDPGMAFGSGAHPTTRLCLKWIADVLWDGLRVLDFGCGSGVLAIAAARLGAGHVTAVDIDPQAVLATRDNAAFNRIDADRFEVGTTADFRPEPGSYDVVMANILLNPLIELAPTLTALLARSGRLLLSGVLATQEEDLRAGYPRIRFDSVTHHDGWLRLTGLRDD